MTMDAQQRIDRIARFLAGQFSCGVSSISRDDEIEDGVLLRTEIDAVLRGPLARGAEGDLALLAEALSTIGGVWDSGYDLASGEDIATDDGRTVAEIVSAYADSLTEAPSPA